MLQHKEGREEVCPWVYAVKLHLCQNLGAMMQLVLTGSAKEAINVRRASRMMEV